MQEAFKSPQKEVISMALMKFSELNCSHMPEYVSPIVSHLQASTWTLCLCYECIDIKRV